MTTLLRSQIECPNCHQVIASIHRHDFRTCDCGDTSIDGGRDYLRVVGKHGFIGRSLIVPGDLSKQEAAHVLHVYKALLECERLSGENPVRTVFVWSVFSNELLRRPNGVLYVGQRRVRGWLGLLEEAGAVQGYYNAQRYLCWRSLLPWAEHPDA